MSAQLRDFIFEDGFGYRAPTVKELLLSHPYQADEGAMTLVRARDELGHLQSLVKLQADLQSILDGMPKRGRRIR